MCLYLDLFYVAEFCGGAYSRMGVETKKILDKLENCIAGIIYQNEANKNKNKQQYCWLTKKICPHRCTRHCQANDVIVPHDINIMFVPQQFVLLMFLLIKRNIQTLLLARFSIEWRRTKNPSNNSSQSQRTQTIQ